MTYIIATTDRNGGDELINILKEDKTLVFQGCFTSFKAIDASVWEKPPDMAFIWLGESEINAFRLASEIKARNPFSIIIFVGSQRESAVEAFEHEADGFLLTPFDKKKVSHLLLQSTKKEEMKS